jgi:hypothetical protein
MASVSDYARLAFQFLELHTRGESPNLPLALSVARQQHPDRSDDEHKKRLSAFRLVMTDWAKMGLPRFDVSTALAASLMATNTDTSSNSVIPPWGTFAVNLPAGLLSSVDGFALVSFGDAGSVYLTINLGDGPHEEIAGTAYLRDIAGLGNSGTKSGRIVHMVTRLVIGLCLEVASRSGFSTWRHGQYTSKCRVRRGEPKCQTYIVGRPVRVDVRKAVTDYVLNGSGAPTVQTLVMGHWKQQAYGPKARMRKSIHIEPYWRGPEDAPIVVRPHVVC